MPATQEHNDLRFKALLEKWQNGEFTLADEQELNLLIQQDPFTREAMDGFRSMPMEDHGIAIAQLGKAIKNKAATRKPILSLYTLYTIAAVGLILVAAIFLFPTKNVSSPGLAENKTPAETETSGSTLNAEPIAADDQALVFTPQNDLTREKKPAPKPDYGSGTAILKEEDVSSKVELEPTKPSPISQSDESKKIATPDELVLAESVENAVKTDKAKMSRTAAPAKKELEKSPVLSKPGSGVKDQNLAIYLRQNARLTELARNNNVSGNVRLQVVFDQKSAPIKIDVLQPLGFGCDEAAINLIRNYSGFTYRDTTVQIEVPFVR